VNSPGANALPTISPRIFPQSRPASAAVTDVMSAAEEIVAAHTFRMASGASRPIALYASSASPRTLLTLRAASSVSL
jgi:hypothetical protein